MKYNSEGCGCNDCGSNDCCDSLEVTTVECPPGPKGPKGPQGADGDRGPQGIQGPQGDVGPQGLQGLQGDKGPKGDKGPAGDKGLQGPAGDKGLQGPPGDKGVTGDDGTIDTSMLISKMVLDADMLVFYNKDGLELSRTIIPTVCDQDPGIVDDNTKMVSTIVSDATGKTQEIYYRVTTNDIFSSQAAAAAAFSKINKSVVPILYNTSLKTPVLGQIFPVTVYSGTGSYQAFAFKYPGLFADAKQEHFTQVREIAYIAGYASDLIIKNPSLSTIKDVADTVKYWCYAQYLLADGTTTTQSVTYTYIRSTNKITIDNNVTTSTLNFIDSAVSAGTAVSPLVTIKSTSLNGATLQKLEVKAFYEV